MATADEKNGLTHPRFPGAGEPTWQLAYFFPAQGAWKESDYLGLEDRCGGHIRAELVEGRLEVLPMPTEHHQDIILFLLAALQAFVNPRKLGKISFSGIRVRLQAGEAPEFREPDIAFMSADHAHRRHEEFWEGADLVMEVVSGDWNDHQRDYVAKKKDYAQGKVAEYWIVNPVEKRVQVWTLQDGAYHQHGEFLPGGEASSVLLAGFVVAVAEVLAAGQ